MDLFANTIALVRREQPEQLFLVRVVAVPAPDSPEIGEVGGAYANCWVDADDLRSAEQTTLAAISREGWYPQKFERWNLVSRDSYMQDASHSPEEIQAFTEHIEEAFADGYSLTFYCWPPDAPDANDEASLCDPVA